MDKWKTPVTLEQFLCGDKEICSFCIILININIPFLLTKHIFQWLQPSIGLIGNSTCLNKLFSSPERAYSRLCSTLPIYIWLVCLDEDWPLAQLAVFILLALQPFAFYIVVKYLLFIACHNLLKNLELFSCLSNESHRNMV